MNNMAAEIPIVPAAFDLEAYIGRYSAGSETRLQRLLFIADRTRDAELSTQAYQIAERQMRETSNVRCYKEVFGTGYSKGGVVYDAAWVEETELATQTAMETLEGRLSAAQAHLQKEAIRTAYLAIGEFARQHGDLQSAIRAILRSRDYCTNRNQTAHVCLLVIELAIQMRNYQQAHEYVTKAEHSTIPGDVTFTTKLKVASGVAFLADRKFLDAANQLTSVPLADEGNPFASGVASAEDVALYETLCALATMDRDQLQRLLETQANGFLDLAPSLRYVLQHYCRADYPGCLRILYQLRPALELDMFLEPHLEKLFDTIMQKCIIEYLKPYRKVNLVHMASIFSTPIDRLIPMLAELIGAGRIPHARIDCLEQTLERRTDEALVQRQLTTKKKILAMEQNILNDAHAMIIRVACLENEGDDRRKPSYAVEYMESDDDDNDGEPMDLVAGNPEDVY